jgi:hypothetical protein
MAKLCPEGWEMERKGTFLKRVFETGKVGGKDRSARNSENLDTPSLVTRVHEFPVSTQFLLMILYEI